MHFFISWTSLEGKAELYDPCAELNRTPALADDWIVNPYSHRAGLNGLQQVQGKRPM